MKKQIIEMEKQLEKEHTRYKEKKNAKTDAKRALDKVSKSIKIFRNIIFLYVYPFKNGNLQHIGTWLIFL